MLQNQAKGGWTALILILLGLIGFGLESAQAQTTFTYIGTNGGSWIRNTNWSGGGTNKTPGVDANASSITDGATTDIASFSTSSTILSVGINFNTSANSGVGSNSGANQSLTLGAITFGTGGTAGNFLIGNNSTTLDGTLTLTGVTVGSDTNVIAQNGSSSSLTLANVQGSGNKAMDVALGNTTDNVAVINGSGNIVISSIIKNGAGSNLTKAGSGTGLLSLTGNNTFSGATVIKSGTLSAGAATGGALAGTSGVTVNSGGTLLLAVANQIKNSGTMTLNGGTFKTGGLSEGTSAAVGIGALTLSTNSTLDFGAGSSSVLHFADSSGTGDYSGLMFATNYMGEVSDFGIQTGTPGDSLYFGSSSSALTAQQLGQIRFVDPFGYSGTYGAVFGSGGQVLAAVPEPTTWMAGALLLGFVGWRERKRIGKLM